LIAWAFESRAAIGFPKTRPSQYPKAQDRFKPIQLTSKPGATPNARPAHVQMTLDGIGSRMSEANSVIVTAETVSGRSETNEFSSHAMMVDSIHAPKITNGTMGTSNAIATVRTGAN